MGYKISQSIFVHIGDHLPPRVEGAPVLQPPAFPPSGFFSAGLVAAAAEEPPLLKPPALPVGTDLVVPKVVLQASAPPASFLSSILGFFYSSGADEVELSPDGGP